MDDDRFDSFARFLGTPRSRRSVVQILAGSAAGGLAAMLGRGGAEADACKEIGKPCKKGGQCCSGNCAPTPSGSISTAGSASLCCTRGQVQDPFGACCTPTTCAAEGKNCGSVSDGCGTTLSCGSCTAPTVCYQGSCCTPKRPEEVCTRCNCAKLDDGCGGTVDCGTYFCESFGLGMPYCIGTDTTFTVCCPSPDGGGGEVCVGDVSCPAIEA